MNSKLKTISEIKSLALTSKKISTSFPNLLKESIAIHTSTLNVNSSITERAFCLINNISTSPICKVCNSKKLKFISFEKGFHEFCSSKCKIEFESESGVLIQKENFKNILSTIYLKVHGSTYDPFLKENKLLFSLRTYTNFLEKKVKNTERIFCIMNDITSTPICKHCKEKEVKYINFDVGYRDYCSVKCSSNSIEKQTAIIETNLDKHGHMNAFQSKEGRKGYDSFFQDEEKVKEATDKGKETKIKRYGPDAFKKISAKVQKIMKETMINGESLQTISSRKSLKTRKEKYGSSLMKDREKVTSIRREIFIQNRTNVLLSDFNIKNLFELKDYKGANIKYLWKCLSCELTYMKAITGSHPFPLCPKCNKNNIQSKGEETLFEFLLETNYLIIRRDNSIIKPKEVDLIIEDKKTGIEYNGLYFHSYERLLFKNKFTETQAENYHLMKTEKMEKAGYDLIHIFEHEWLFKKEITKSLILNKLGLIKNKIGVRDCYIKEILLEDASEFLEENHIQGKDTSKIRIGLFLKKDVKGYKKDTLVSLMTFKKPRYNKEAQWELKRFCSLLNLSIQGADSKLLEYFEEKYKPSSLLFYDDKRYSFAYAYEKLGFEYKWDTKPNFFYFKRFNIYSKDMFMKDKIKEYFEKGFLITSFDEELTEYENMVVNGFKKVYDCGNKILIKEYYLQSTTSKVRIYRT